MKRGDRGVAPDLIAAAAEAKPLLELSVRPRCAQVNQTDRLLSRCRRPDRRFR